MKSRILLQIVAWLALAWPGFAQTVDTVLTNGLSEPYGIVVDRSTTNNYYYLTDSVNNRVVRFQPISGEIVDLTGPAFFSPQGIVLARGGLVVADAGSHLIQKVTPEGDVSLLAGSDRGLADGAGVAAKFDTPSGLAVDAAGNIYIADTRNNVIRKLAPDDTVSTYAVGFNRPTGLAISETGRLFVADTGNHVIKVVETDGTIRVIAGTPGSNIFDNDFNGPRSLLWVGGATGLLVSDTYNQVIRRVFLAVPSRPNNWSLATYAGGLHQGGSANGAVADARFLEPAGLGLDLEGAIVVADLKNNAVRRINRPRLAIPSLNLAGGSFSNAVTVTTQTVIPGASYYYTLGQSDPTPASAVFANVPINGGPTDLNVRAFSPDSGSSPTLQVRFKFFVNPLEVNPRGGSFTNDTEINVITATEGAIIRYTTSTNAPTTNSTQWTSTTWGRKGRLQLKAFKEGYEPTAVEDLAFSFKVVTPVITSAGLPWLALVTNNTVEVAITSGTRTAAVLWRSVVAGHTNDWADVSTLPAKWGTPGEIQAYATNAFYDDSEQAKTSYSFKVATPKIAPEDVTAHQEVDVDLTSVTPGAALYWTINGVDPTNKISATNFLVPPGQAINLDTAGTVKVRGFLGDFEPSDVARADFRLEVATPKITFDPLKQTNNAPVTVSLDSGTIGASIYWTLDGTTPTNSTGNAQFVASGGTVTIDRSGTFRAKAFYKGFVPAEATNAPVFTLLVEKPTVSKAAGAYTDKVEFTLATATPEAALFYSLDGSTPSAGSTAYTAGSTLTLKTNATLKVVGLRAGFTASEVVAVPFTIKVSNPTMLPADGFFPDGATVTLADVNTSAKLFYTLDGREPTTSSIRYTGPFKVSQLTGGANLREVRVRAFVDGADPSDIITGGGLASSITKNVIGFSRTSLVAGVGASVLVPVTVVLKPGDQLQSLQYKLLFHPIAPTVTPLPAQPVLMPVTGTAYPGVAKSDKDPVAVFFAPGTSGATNSLEVVFPPPSPTNKFFVSFAAVVGLVKVTLPPNAAPDDAYAVELVFPSGTSDGSQSLVTLEPSASATITVVRGGVGAGEVSYLVGDTSPNYWFNGGDFGDDELNNADFNNIFLAALGVNVPYTFTDLFDAMDAFPEDTDTSVGGDGQVRFLDWQVVLFRSLRQDPSNWRRYWTNGVRKAVSTRLPGAAQDPGQELDARISAQPWPDAEVASEPVGHAKAGERTSLPVFVNVLHQPGLVGLQFRARVAPQADAPPVTGPLAFAPAPGFSAPFAVAGLPVNELAGAWGPLLNPLPQVLSGRVQVGSITFTVPAAARPGQSYTLEFANADGAPDRHTQLDFTTRQGTATVEAPPKPPADARMAIQGIKLRWFAAAGQRFAVESTTDLAGGLWKVEADNLEGAGRALEFVARGLEQQNAKFYRLRNKQ